MNRPLLLRAMIAKELRTTLRQRQQIWGLIITLLVFVFVIGMGVREYSQRTRSPVASGAHVQAAPPPETRPAASAASRPATASSLNRVPQLDAMIIRWISIGLGAGLTLFLSLGYLLAATLATFAGEKDNRTLEILLASPVDDTTLFVTKCLSVLLPMSAIGYLLFLIPASVAAFLLRSELARLPISIPVHALLLSIPVMLLVSASVVALGAAVSAKSQSLKGASQVFGALFFIVFFGGGYGLPLILRFTPLGPPVRAFGKAWLQMPFIAQYAAALLVLAVPAAILTLVALALFKRDRLLT